MSDTIIYTEDFITGYLCYEGTLNYKKFDDDINLEFVQEYFKSRDFLTGNLCLPLNIKQGFNDREGQFVEVAVIDYGIHTALESIKGVLKHHEIQYDTLILRKVEKNMILQAISYVFDSFGDKETGVIPIRNKSDAEHDSGEMDELIVDSFGANVADSEAVKAIKILLNGAILRGASDIHLEPFELYARVRFREASSMYIFKDRISLSQYNSIVNCLKIYAHKDIAQTRLPQDGSFSLRHEGGKIDVRFSSLPTVNGEKVVMRLLDPKSDTLNLDQIIWDKEQRKTFIQASHLPHGIILVTGPTGSGKTTTLHKTLGVLSKAYNDTKNIITVEDPVEYKVPGISHVEAKEQIGLTFAAALRSIVRQDPDIIMIGEIRDGETAQIAIQAAMTGHLVLSTLHTNDAITSIARLQDLEARPYLIAVTVALMQAQRLVRRICPHCMTPIKDKSTVDEYFSDYRLLDHPSYEKFMDSSLELFEPNVKGCDYCHNSGYESGRIAVMEMVRVTNELKTLIAKQVPLGELTTAAKGAGYRPMFEYALDLVINRKTSLDEAFNLMTEM